jgi:hypothetical protein
MLRLRGPGGALQTAYECNGQSTRARHPRHRRLLHELGSHGDVECRCFSPVPDSPPQPIRYRYRTGGVVQTPVRSPAGHGYRTGGGCPVPDRGVSGTGQSGTGKGGGVRYRTGGVVH